MIIHEGAEFNLKIKGIGKVIVQTYLGSGGFADVWMVEGVSTKKQYVLKNIQVKNTVKDKETFIKRIENEASVNIPSEYIVSSLGLERLEENRYAILFPFVKGISLSDWIMDNKKSPWAKRKTLFIKLLKGVSHAHKTNVIHRDLKPQNVLITADDNPKIIDFGLAKFKDKSITVTGDFAGTLPYADPEAFLSGIKYVDARCDIYALGIMLYEMVMGANPWTLNGFEYGEFIRYIIEGKTNLLEIDRAYKFNEDATIKGVIEKATSFDSAHRITTVNDMISLLGDAPEIRKPITVDFSIASPVLIVEDGSAKGAMNVLTIPDGGSKLLGRHNLDATNGTISKNHAVISRKGNKYFIYDDNSSNGTFVGGNKLKPGEEYLQEIKHTDRIRFADLWTRFVFLKRD